MAKAGARLGPFVYAMAIVLTLSFGARAALSQPVAMTCNDDGWLWLGACSSGAQCTADCQAIHGPDAHGNCNVCCRCAW